MILEINYHKLYLQYREHVDSNPISDMMIVTSTAHTTHIKILTLLTERWDDDESTR